VGWHDFLNPFTWRADRRGVRADRRGERELTLAEEREASQRRAILGARYKSEPYLSQPSVSVATGTIENAGVRTTPLAPASVRHVFLVKNAGPAPAQKVTVWLAYGLNEENMARRTEEKRIGLLHPIDDEHVVELVETGFDGGYVPRDGSLMCRWTDGEGLHVGPLLDVTLHV
jgi:hypothetical protein